MFYYNSADIVGRSEELGTPAWFHLNKYVIRLFLFTYGLLFLGALSVHLSLEGKGVPVLIGIMLFPLVLSSLISIMFSLQRVKQAHYVWQQVFLFVPLLILRQVMYREAGNASLRTGRKTVWY